MKLHSTDNHNGSLITIRAQKAYEIGAFELKDVQFETNMSELKHTTKLVLSEFADYIISNPKYTVQIEGHTDNVGTANDNLILSQSRAKAVKDFFEVFGIEPSRLKAYGYGESTPKASNDTKEGRALNRRTEFTVKIKK